MLKLQFDWYITVRLFSTRSDHSIQNQLSGHKLCLFLLRLKYYKQREMSKKIITNFIKMIFSLLPFHAGSPFSLFFKVVSPVSLIFSGRFSLLPKPFLSPLKVQEKKRPIVNQQCVVYKFQCDLCDASYVGYTLRHLHQCVNEHKNLLSSIGKHYCDKHCIVPKDLDKQFFVSKKCRNKFDCLVYEMLLIRELTPSLNVQSDSVRVKLFA